MAKAPSSIFKYEPFTLRALQNLKAQSIHFGSPKGFNDPYDCGITATIAEPTLEEVELAREHYLSSPTTTEEEKAHLRQYPVTELKRQLLGGAQAAASDVRESFLSKRGVACFSECNDNLLMWSHYGGQYRGFCLEFLTDREPFNKLYQVTYTDTMPRLSLIDFLKPSSDAELFVPFCTKSTAWAYEREWRAIHTEVGTLYTYPPDSLKAIYLGPEISQQDLDMICLILAGQNPDVQLHRGTRSVTQFKVEFEAFTYTPLAEAKRLTGERR